MDEVPAVIDFTLVLGDLPWFQNFVSILNNPAVPEARILEAISEPFRGSATPTESNLHLREALWSLLSDRQCPTMLIDLVASSSRSGARFAVASNPNLSAAQVRTLLIHTHVMLDTPDLLDELIANPAVTDAMVADVPSDTGLEMLTLIASRLSGLTRETFLSRFFGDADTIPAGALVLARYSEEPSILGQLGESNNAEIREQVGFNPATPASTVARLCRDGRHIVRAAAATHDSATDTDKVLVAISSSVPDGSR